MTRFHRSPPRPLTEPAPALAELLAQALGGVMPGLAGRLEAFLDHLEGRR